MGYDMFSLPPQVIIALDALRPEEKVEVMRAIYDLRDLSHSQETMDRYQVKKLPSEKDLYLARATPQIRLFLRIDESARTANVVDIVRQETLDKFAREMAGPPSLP